MMQEEHIKVGIADMNIAVGDGKIKTAGLGSCVGVTLFDPIAKAGGLAHIMLPSSEMNREKDINAAKYADTAIPELIRLMEEKGAMRNRMQAKLAGGAQMFPFSHQNDTMRIGARNVEACKKILNRYQIPIIAEDTGGNYGRTIELCCRTGILTVRTVQHGIKEI